MGGTVLSATKAKKLQRKRQRARERETISALRTALEQAVAALAELDAATEPFSVEAPPKLVGARRMGGEAMGVLIPLLART